jgi:hypothetical protein
MKKLLLFAAVAGLGLVSASPPPKGPDNGPREARRHYPPCSRTVTDRCIQLYERGVREQFRGDGHARMDDRGRHHAYAEYRGRPDDLDDDDDDGMDRGRGHGDMYADDDRRGRHGLMGDGDHDGRFRRLGYDDHDGGREHHGRRGHRGYGEGHARGDHSNCPDHHARVERHVQTIVYRPARRMVRTAQVTRVVGCRCNPPARRHYAQRVRRAGERG